MYYNLVIAQHPNTAACDCTVHCISKLQSPDTQLITSDKGDAMRTMMPIEMSRKEHVVCSMIGLCRLVTSDMAWHC